MSGYVSACLQRVCGEFFFTPDDLGLCPHVCCYPYSCVVFGGYGGVFGVLPVGLGFAVDA